MSSRGEALGRPMGDVAMSLKSPLLDYLKNRYQFEYFSKILHKEAIRYLKSIRKTRESRSTSRSYQKQKQPPEVF